MYVCMYVCRYVCVPPSLMRLMRVAASSTLNQCGHFIVKVNGAFSVLVYISYFSESSTHLVLHGDIK